MNTFKRKIQSLMKYLGSTFFFKKPHIISTIRRTKAKWKRAGWPIRTEKMTFIKTKEKKEMNLVEEMRKSICDIKALLLVAHALSLKNEQKREAMKFRTSI